jgi:hypothetical protein
MLTYYPRYAPGQDLLLSSSLSDWLLESHLAYSISGSLMNSISTSFYSRYDVDSRLSAPYEPLTMFKVLVYVYSERGVLFTPDRQEA